MPDATLKPYDPTWRDSLAALLMGSDHRASNARAALVQGLMGSRGLGTTGMGVIDFTPPGQVMGAQEAYRDTGDPAQAAFAMLPIPGAAPEEAASRAIARRLTQMGGPPIPGKPSVVKIPGMGEMPAAPIQELQDAAQKYMASIGRPNDHNITSYPPFDENMARRIADAFDQMKHDPTNPAVKRSYDAMIDETLGQYKAMKDAGVTVNFIKPGQADPYAASPAMGYADLVNNGHLWTFPTDSGFGTLNKVEDNPLLKRVGPIGDLPNATANDAFRVVHDIYGHFGPGNPFFRHKGEERAWFNHSQMYSPEARGAMTTETRGQNSWLNFGPFGEQNRTANSDATIFADQKIGLLPPWAQEIAKKYGIAALGPTPLLLWMQQQPGDQNNGS